MPRVKGSSAQIEYAPHAVATQDRGGNVIDASCVCIDGMFKLRVNATELKQLCSDTNNENSSAASKHFKTLTFASRIVSKKSCI